MGRAAEQSAIERFVRERGVLRCPTAHAAPSEQSDPTSESHLPPLRHDFKTGLWRREPA